MMNGAIGAGMSGAAPAADAPQPAALQVFPFFHIGGLSGLYIFTAFGAKLVTMYKWDTEEALEILEREEITATGMVPTLLRALLESPSLTKRHLDRLGGHLRSARRSRQRLRPHRDDIGRDHELGAGVLPTPRQHRAGHGRDRSACGRRRRQRRVDRGDR
jgi:hypothetical protein